MNSNTRETALFRKSLLGIRVTPFQERPLFRIQHWKIYNAGSVDVLPPEDRIRNVNFQIERGANEKILVRVFLSKDRKVIERTKIYYLLKNTDSESALYLSYAVLMRMNLSISPVHELLPFAF